MRGRRRWPFVRAVALHSHGVRVRAVKAQHLRLAGLSVRTVALAARRGRAGTRRKLRDYVRAHARDRHAAAHAEELIAPLYFRFGRATPAHGLVFTQQLWRNSRRMLASRRSREANLFASGPRTMSPHEHEL